LGFSWGWKLNFKRDGNAQTKSIAVKESSQPKNPKLKFLGWDGSLICQAQGNVSLCKFQAQRAFTWGGVLENNINHIFGLHLTT